MAETQGLWRKLVYWFHRVEHVLGRVHLLVWLAGIAGGGAMITGGILVWQFLGRGDVSWARGAAIGSVISLSLLALCAIAYYVKRRQSAEIERQSIEAAVEAARHVIKMGRWVYGPRTTEGTGRTYPEVSDAWRAFDRAVTVYRGRDGKQLRDHSDRIQKAISRHDYDTGTRLNPLLDSLEKWTEWAEKELLRVDPIKRHPLSRRP